MLNTLTMNLNLVRTFVVVGQSKDIKSASEKLNMDQSNVIRNIKKLEENYPNTKLVRNYKNYIELTENGKMVFEYYEKAYNLLLLAEKTYLQTNCLDAAKITFGTTLESNSDLLISNTNKFKKKYSNIAIKMVRSSSKELVDKLSQYSLDFIIGEKYDNLKKSSEVKSIDLLEDEYCIAYSSNKFKVENLKQLETLQLILPTREKKARRLFDEKLEKLKIDSKLSLELDDDNEIKMSAINGDGVALLPKRLVEKSELSYLDLELYVTISISYIAENLTPPAREFIENWH